MAQSNSLNIKLSNSQLNILNSAMNNKNEIVSRLSSNMIEKKLIFLMNCY